MSTQTFKITGLGVSPKELGIPHSVVAQGTPYKSTRMETILPGYQIVEIECEEIEYVLQFDLKGYVTVRVDKADTDRWMTPIYETKDGKFFAHNKRASGDGLIAVRF